MLRRADIDDWWSMVAFGAEEIRSKSPFDYSLDELRERTRRGELRLLIDPPKVGFFIVQLKMQPILHLFIWMAWSGEKEPLMAVYQKQLEELARIAGAKYLEMISSRRGYERAGWIPVSLRDEGIVYQKGITHGWWRRQQRSS